MANLIEMYSPQNSAESLNEIYVVLDRNGYTLSYLIYINFKLSLPNLSFVFYQLLAAVNYLHSQRIILMVRRFKCYIRLKKKSLYNPRD